MLIDFIPSRSKLLYQRISDNTFTFTSNNNLNLRLPKDERNNIYLDEMKGGEDVLLCLSLLKQSKKYLIDNDIKMYHKPRESVPSLLKQFYNYGKYSSDALGNVKLTQLEFFYLWNLMADEFQFLTKFSFPIKGLIYLSYSFLHQILLVLSICTLEPNLFIASILFFIVLLVREIPLLFKKGLIKGLQIFLVSYLVNWAFLLGSIRNTIKNRVIFIPPQLRRSKFDYPAKFKIIAKRNVPEEILNALYAEFESHAHDQSKLEFLSKKIIRFRHKGSTVVLRRFGFFISFYKVVDLYCPSSKA